MPQCVLSSPVYAVANPPVRFRRDFHAVRAKKMRSSVEMTESDILFLRPHLSRRFARASLNTEALSTENFSRRTSGTCQPKRGEDRLHEVQGKACRQAPKDVPP